MSKINNSYNLLKKVLHSFRYRGWVNGLSQSQYDVLNEANEYVQLSENMRNRKIDHPKIAKKLRSKGHTIREIAEILGYRHPGSITNLLNK